MQPYRGYAHYAGRVGALALGLGIASATISGAGTAWAEDSEGSPGASASADGSTGGSESAAAGADGRSSAGSTGSVDAGEADPNDLDADPDADPNADPDTDADADFDSDSDAEGAESDESAESGGEAADPESDDTEDPDATTGTEVSDATTGAEGLEEPATTDHRTVATTESVQAQASEASEASGADSEADPDDDAQAGATGASAVADDETDSGPADIVAAALSYTDTESTDVVAVQDDSTVQPEQEVEVASAVLTSVEDDTESTDSPAIPYEQSTLTGLLGLIWRQIEYTFFNKKPTATYDSSLTVQTDEGQITGVVTGADADGDALTYTVVAAPLNGVVTVAADGSFVYTPYAGLAATGGTDSFLVKVSDFANNPLHIHGLELFSGAAYQQVTVEVAATTAISPLATQDQIEAEKLATAIVNTPIMQLAKFLLKLSWKAAAEKQFALVGGLDAESLAQLDRAVDEYALQAALELQLLNPNDPHVLQQVMPTHTWYGEFFAGARILYDNPDTVYRMIAVNASSSYVITGQFTGTMPADTTFSVLTGLTGTTTQVLTADDLIINADGSFTITVDSTPGDGTTNHLQLPSDATLIAARNTLSDWSTEVPMTLSIERVSGPANNLFSQLGFYDIPVIGSLFSSTPILSQLLSLVPALDPMPLWLQATETALVMALGLIMEPQYIAVATTDPDTGELREPNTLSEPAHNATFLANQLQSAGYFQLADDEALVITIDPGSAGYFVVPVTNVWTITGNYWDEQTSLNDTQALQNADGTYTMVLSPTEPCDDSGSCVANWLSTGGLNQGTLSIRFQDIDLEAYVAPTVSVRLVKLGDLADELPEGTVYLTPEERDEVIAARKAGYENRYTPYLQD